MTDDTIRDADRGMRGIDAVREFLDREQVHYELVEHEETFAADREAHSAGIDPGDMAKTVILHDRGGLRAAVLPASERLDLHKARTLLGGTSHMRLATEAEITEGFPAFEPGALPPFSTLLALPEVVDRRLMDRERIACSGGDHRHSLMVAPHVLDRLGAPLVGDISQP